jgi:hypothetical protein
MFRLSGEMAAALGILMNKATAPDGTVELQGVLGGQGTAKHLQVSSFKALAVAPARLRGTGRRVMLPSKRLRGVKGGGTCHRRRYFARV